MLKYIGKRLAQGLLLLVVFLALVYLLLEAQPGDISQQLIANPEIPPEAQELLRQRLGLDQPLLGRTVTYVFNFFQGDLGLSFTQYPNTVGELIMERLPRTVTLFLSAVLVSYYLGFGLGKIMAWRRGRSSETALTLAGVAGYTVFYPWFAILMLWFFGFILDLFPIGKFIDVNEWTGAALSANQVFIRMLLSAIILTVLAVGVVAVSHVFQADSTGRRVRRVGIPALVIGFVAYWWFSPLRPFVGDILHHTALPVLTLSLVNFSGVMLLTRASMLETLREDYILTARAKGLSERTIRDHHAARNALLPVVTSLVLALSFVIGGGILTEAIFSWPGLGQMLLGATLLEDLPLATGTLGIIGMLALVGHIIADVVYMFLDPRIRYQ
ncbi:MAG TPA: ABC transporter permease [Acidimicrobiia bacterium]|jgi:peptide/nickel transport system permease protein|nr:ABC transporter permease [Acidimicrobiia bacterium]